jgi:TorA maturation chaperone TorD
MLLDDSGNDRAEAYRVLADLFSRPPDSEELEALKEDLELESKETADEIGDAFDSLFALPGGKLPPMESLFLGTEGLNTVNQVTSFYADAGLTIDDEFMASPDHLSLEFLFMSYLIDSKKPDLQQKFLETHIMNWVPDYCEEVMRQAEAAFYREIADATRNFINNEYDNFE